MKIFHVKVDQKQFQDLESFGSQTLIYDERILLPDTVVVITPRVRIPEIEDVLYRIVVGALDVGRYVIRDYIPTEACCDELCGNLSGSKNPLDRERWSKLFPMFADRINDV